MRPELSSPPVPPFVQSCPQTNHCFRSCSSGFCSAPVPLRRGSWVGTAAPLPLTLTWGWLQPPLTAKSRAAPLFVFSPYFPHLNQRHSQACLPNGTSSPGWVQNPSRPLGPPKPCNEEELVPAQQRPHVTGAIRNPPLTPSPGTNPHPPCRILTTNTWVRMHFHAPSPDHGSAPLYPQPRSCHRHRVAAPTHQAAPLAPSLAQRQNPHHDVKPCCIYSHVQLHHGDAKQARL